MARRRIFLPVYPSIRISTDPLLYKIYPDSRLNLVLNFAILMAPHASTRLPIVGLLVLISVSLTQHTVAELLAACIFVSMGYN